MHCVNRLGFKINEAMRTAQVDPSLIGAVALSAPGFLHGTDK